MVKLFLLDYTNDSGRMIKAARELRGLNQKALAKLADTHQSRISDWENNKPSVTMAQFFFLMECMEFDVELNVRTKG